MHKIMVQGDTGHRQAGISMRALFAITAIAAGLLGGARRSPGPDLLVYTVDRESSRVHIVTHRAGLLSFLGHEHAIVPHEWTVELCLADSIPTGAYGALTVRTQSLEIDSDSARALAGLGGGPGKDDVRTIQRKLLDKDHLAAEQYPEIRLQAVVVEPETEGRLLARGTITIRGVSRAIELPVTVDRSGGRTRLSGSLRIRQRDFGIEPESIALVVKVADEVDLHFSLVAVPTGRACPLTEGD